MSSFFHLPRNRPTFPSNNFLLIPDEVEISSFSQSQFMADLSSSPERENYQRKLLVKLFEVSN